MKMMQKMILNIIILKKKMMITKNIMQYHKHMEIYNKIKQKNMNELLKKKKNENNRIIILMIKIKQKQKIILIQIHDCRYHLLHNRHISIKLLLILE